MAHNYNMHSIVDENEINQNARCSSMHANDDRSNYITNYKSNIFDNFVVFRDYYAAHNLQRRSFLYSIVK
jgi:hypothetical protein